MSNLFNISKSVEKARKIQYKLEEEAIKKQTIIDNKRIVDSFDFNRIYKILVETANTGSTKVKALYFPPYNSLSYYCIIPQQFSLTTGTKEGNKKLKAFAKENNLRI